MNIKIDKARKYFLLLFHTAGFSISNVISMLSLLWISNILDPHEIGTHKHTLSPVEQLYNIYKLPVYFVLNLALLGTIREELLFRSVLKNSENYSRVFVALWISFFINVLTKTYTEAYLPALERNFLWFVLIYFLVPKTGKISPIENNLYLSSFVSSLLYSAMHSMHEDHLLSGSNALSYFAYLLPGLYLCFIRVKFGLTGSILAHALHNGAIAVAYAIHRA